MRQNRFLSLLLALTMSVGCAWAQTAGSTISGRIFDTEGPLMMVNIVEIDAANRIVAHGITDINGNFSFKIRDPKNKLQVSYVGYVTQTIPIKGTVYNIKLKDATQLEEFVVQATRKSDHSGLAIPERELSIAAQRISAQEFEGLGVTTIDEALQGRISGLDIVANSGNLGSGSTMRLRGVSSINSNAEPLIVVDGNVWETDVNNFDFSSANDEKFAELLKVNPEDIASISVLKDAAATAIWGSQGANGVIEIKTKRGARGKTRVTYSYRYTGTYQPKGFKMLNGSDYTMLMQEAYFNPELSDKAANIKEFKYVQNDPTYTEYYNYAQNTDWVDEVTQYGALHKHYISITGGGEKANFRISGGYDGQTGTVIAQELGRFTTRVALDYFVSDRIKIMTDFSMTYTDNKKNYQDLLGVSYQKMPNLSVWEYDQFGNRTGDYYMMLNSASSELDDQRKLINPVAVANLAKNDEKSYNIEPDFRLHYNLLGLTDDKTRLTYEGQIRFNIVNKYNESFYPSSLISSGWSSTDANKAINESHKSLGITTTHTFTFLPYFSNINHSFMALARGQVNSGDSNSQKLGKYGLPSGDINSPSGGGIVGNDFSTGAGEWRSVYFTFSAHYAYKGKYIADFSVRRDGSTKFGPDYRWGNFPALSLRWNVSDEKFMDALPWISMLSLRPGWGIVGVQPNEEALYYSKYSAGASYNGSNSIRPSNIRLSNLKWEEKETWNLGIDLGLFNDKISADFNIYTQTTRDLLMKDRVLPGSSGFDKLAYQNVGKMRNNGWEFNINTYKMLKIGNLDIDFNVTFANNKNEILEMEPTVLASLQKEFDGNNGSYLSRVQLKNAFGSIYGFKYKGVYQYSDYSEVEVKGVSGPNAPVFRNAAGEVVTDENGNVIPMMYRYGKTDYEFKGGDAMYEDVNNDGNIDELDIVYLGSSLPKITGGFGIKFKWKRLQWNNQFNFRAGNKIINKARMSAESMYTNNNQSRAVNWRWRVEGDITSVPRALYKQGYNWLGSDRFVEDGSFLRLNYTQISYTLDPKLTKACGVGKVNVFASANNLFCLTKYSGADPEVAYGNMGVTYDEAQTPRARSFTLGLTVDF